MSVGAVAGVAAFEVGRVFEAECAFAAGVEEFASGAIVVPVFTDGGEDTGAGVFVGLASTVGVADIASGAIVVPASMVGGGTADYGAAGSAPGSIMARRWFMATADMAVAAG